MRQVIFIHVPKTAGISIMEFARIHSPWFQEHIDREYNPNAQFSSLRHRSAGYCFQKGLITQDWWERSIVFAVVRNPWDRLVSLFEHLRRQNQQTDIKMRRVKRRVNSQLSKHCRPYLDNFNRFARKITSGSRIVQPVGRRQVTLFSQANSQVKWLQWGVDRILRFEQLSHDWSRFCQEIGLPDVPLPVYNQDESKRDYRTYYDDELKQRVGRFYRSDVLSFGYTFEGYYETHDLYSRTKDGWKIDGEGVSKH